jgi:hypothetical protein
MLTSTLECCFIGNQKAFLYCGKPQLSPAKALSCFWDYWNRQNPLLLKSFSSWDYIKIIATAGLLFIYFFW